MKEGEGKKKFRDKKINGEERKLCRFLKDIGWSVLNRNMKEDEEKE